MLKLPNQNFLIKSLLFDVGYFFEINYEVFVSKSQIYFLVALRWCPEEKVFLVSSNFWKKQTSINFTMDFEMS